MAEEISMSQSRILLLYGEAHATPEVVWSLLGIGVKPVVVFRRGSEAAARRLRGIEVVEGASPSDGFDHAIEEVARLCAEHGCDGVFPLEDPAVVVADGLDESIIRVGVAGDLVELMLDKRRQFRLAAMSGFDVPPWRSWPDDAGGEGASIPEGAPVVVKPALAGCIVGGRFDRGDVWFESSTEKAAQRLERQSPPFPMIIQQAVEGVGEGLFGFGVKQGIRSPSAHRRLRMTNPAGSGSCACISRTPATHELAAAQDFVARSQWQGMFMIELLRESKSERQWFMELNGRPWGSLALARRQGLEYPAWEVKFRLEGEEPPEIDNTSGLVCRHLGREIVHLMHLVRGNRKKAPNWPTVRQSLRLLKWTPSHHWYNFDFRQPGFFLRDAIATIRSQLK